MRRPAIWGPQPHTRSLTLAPGRGGVPEQLALTTILRYAFTDLPVDQNLRAYNGGSVCGYQPGLRVIAPPRRIQRPSGRSVYLCIDTLGVNVRFCRRECYGSVLFWRGDHWLAAASAGDRTPPGWPARQPQGRSTYCFALAIAPSYVVDCRRRLRRRADTRMTGTCGVSGPPTATPTVGSAIVGKVDRGMNRPSKRRSICRHVITRISASSACRLDPAGVAILTTFYEPYPLGSGGPRHQTPTTGRRRCDPGS
jgi:hypothetical protein